jgi:hypothetical protein
MNMLKGQHVQKTSIIAKIWEEGKGARDIYKQRGKDCDNLWLQGIKKRVMLHIILTSYCNAQNKIIANLNN